MLSARAAKCVVSGRGRRKGAFRSISFAMTRSRRATAATALERVFTKCSSRRETMHHLHDKGPIEGTGQGTCIREAKPGARLSGIPRVPHDEYVIADHRNPVKPYIEIDPLVLVVVLDEREQAGAGVEIVLKAVCGHDSGERSRR